MFLKIERIVGGFALRPNDALLTILLTTIILAAGPLAVVIMLLSGNFSIANLIKVLVGVVLCLCAEKYLLTLFFNLLVKKYS